MKRFLILFLLTLPFSYSFRISGIITVNVIIGTIVSIIYLYKIIYKQYKLVRYKEDIILFIFVVILLISILLNGWYDKTLNHLLSYIFLIVVYFICVRNAMILAFKNYKDILSIILFSLVFSLNFVNIEFYIRNFNRSLIWIIDIMQNNTAGAYDPTFVGIYNRSRGFSIESGHFTMYLNAFVPLLSYYVYTEKGVIIKFIYPILILFSYLSIFSAGGIGSIAIALFLVLLFFLFRQIKLKKPLYIFLFLGVVSLIFILVIWLDHSDNIFISSLMSKILFKENSGRFMRWEIMINEIKSMNVYRLMFGYGVGFMSSVHSLDGTNLYLKLFVEIGFLGLSTFIVLVVQVLIRIKSLTSSIKYPLAIGMLSQLVHFFIVSDYAYPWFWILMAFSLSISFTSEKNKEVLLSKRKF